MCDAIFTNDKFVFGIKQLLNLKPALLLQKHREKTLAHN